MKQDILIFEISMGYFVRVNPLNSLTYLFEIKASQSIINEPISVRYFPQLASIAEFHEKVEIMLIFEGSDEFDDTWLSIEFKQ